jgi:endonuclease/exonuclease/phosphatase family metal-dependent hydrolase
MIRVMTYNVRYFSHNTRGLTSTAAAVHRVARAIASLAELPDVICLQEVETTSLRSTLLHRPSHPTETQLDRLLAALAQHLAAAGRKESYQGHYFPAHRYSLTRQTNFYTTGLVTLVRAPLHMVDHNAASPHDITHRALRPGQLVVPHPEGKKPWLKQTRICAHVSVQHPSGETVDIFNTHLSLPSFLNPGFWLERKRMGFGPNQLEEARNLQGFIDARRQSDRFLVVGDFNALPGSPVYRYLTGEAGWHDPLLSHVGGDINVLERFATAGFMQLRMHLDHMLSGPGLRWVDLAGTRPFDDDASPFRGLSDHTPLLGCIDPLPARS